MKRHWIIANSIAWICVIAMIIGSGTALGAESVPPQDGITSLEIVSAAMDAEFSFQGVLKDQSVPVNGTRNLKFQIHNNATCSNQLQEITMDAVPVVDGRFSVKLLVKHQYFNGQKLYLQVVLGSSNRLMCEEILAVPYALSIMPGAEIITNYAEVEINTYDTNKKVATGIVGAADGGTTNYGVVGSVGAGGGAGVYGISNVAGTPAIYGRNLQTDGVAGDFHGDVKQNVDGFGVVKAGVVAQCSSTSTSIYNKFGPETISITSPGTGRCEIDFGFNLGSKFWSATASATGARLLTCHLDDSNDNALFCFRTDLNGTAENGRIVVLIY